uniref:Ferric-chelate reductase 1 n=1 Tax=Cyclopterus lumpus TaxID=8103 RepID=A0A8C2X723_CYCLU
MEHFVLLLVCVTPLVQCYSSGKVMESCEDMQPYHSGLSPETAPAPYTVKTDHISYRLGEEIQAPASTPFIGFLLQAREVGGRSPVGSFALTTGATQLLPCSQKPNSAVSHTSDSVKTSIQMTWRSEASEVMKPIQFHIISADCGVTKLCFSHPSNCNPRANAKCYFMSAMMLPLTAAAIRYEMTGPSDGYVSFGFSDDQMMGNDDIYICGIGSDGVVQLQHSFSTGQTTPQAVPLGNISDVRASVLDGVISCSFTSINIISTQRTTEADYSALIVLCISLTGQIQFHTGTFISSDKVDISRPRIVRKAGWPHIIKAHGALMLTAWMTLGSLGMMVARYLKELTKRQKLCGKDIWFLVHVAVMSVTIAATIIAFILSFSYVKAWSGGAHPVLGCLVIILSLLQPILALLRFAAILTGLKMIDSSLDQLLMKVMGGLVGWEALCYILQLSLTADIAAITCSCRYMLYNIRRIRPLLTQKAAQVLVQALVISRLDYCNSLLAGLPANAIRPLQLIQNAAARLVFNRPKFTHTTPLLRDLHWLPVAARIRFKTLVLAYRAANRSGPVYIQDMV